MMIKAGIREFLWMAAGGVVFAVITVIVLHFQTGQSPAEKISSKVLRSDLVSGMRLTLTSSSEAEKSAVLAVTDEDSRTFADQSRKAAGEVEQERVKLGELLTAGGTGKEKDLFARFSAAFIELRRIDGILLDLAVKNTNLKAYSLAFGPAAEKLKEMNTSISRLVEKSAGSPDSEKIALYAFGAQTAALRIQALLAPHIAEESGKKMDDMEALMAREDLQVKKDFAGLSIIPKLKGDPDIETAKSDYELFGGIRIQILALSRENTNVRSLAMSLGQKRRVFFMCQDILSTLQQAIQEEPIPGVNGGLLLNPRSLEPAKNAIKN
jgi:hypothetical protein